MVGWEYRKEDRMVMDAVYPVEEPRVTIKVSLTIDGKEFEGEMDGDGFFICDVLKAHRNGNDPVEAMEFLLEVGSKALAHPSIREAFSIETKNRLG